MTGPAIVAQEDTTLARVQDALRSNGRTGGARGGRSKPCRVSPRLTELAVGAARAVGGGFLGVDLVESPDGLQVLEVNHTPEFRGFSSVYGETIDVADIIVSYLLAAA